MKVFSLVGEMACEEFTVLQKGWQLLNNKPALQTSLRTVYIEIKIIETDGSCVGVEQGRREKKQVMGGDPSPLLSTSKASPALLHSSVGYPVQEKCRATG